MKKLPTTIIVLIAIVVAASAINHKRNEALPKCDQLGNLL